MNSYKNYKVLFLYNPSSGKRKVEKNLDYIKDEIIKKYGSCEVCRTESKEHLQKTIREGCLIYDYIFFSGGDGTFNMVVNSIPYGIERLPIFGFLPGGSTNDMSYNLNISRYNIKNAVQDLLNSTPKKYNIGFIGDMKFAYVADFGFATSVAHSTDPEMKKKWGKLAYLSNGIKFLLHWKHVYTLVVDGEIFRTPLIFISNSKEVAAFKINRDVKQNEGNYYIVIVKNGFMHGLFNLAYTFAFGVEAAVKKNKAVSRTAPLFKLNSDNNEWDVDGEKAILKFPCSCGYSGIDIQILTNR